MTTSPTTLPRMGRQKNRVDARTYSGRLAIRIRELREAANLDVLTVAKRMTRSGYKVAVPTLYSWENGTNEMPVNALPFIAGALRVSLHELLPSE